MKAGHQVAILILVTAAGAGGLLVGLISGSRQVKRIDERLHELDAKDPLKELEKLGNQVDRWLIACQLLMNQPGEELEGLTIEFGVGVQDSLKNLSRYPIRPLGYQRRERALWLEGCQEVSALVGPINRSIEQGNPGAFDDSVALKQKEIEFKSRARELGLALDALTQQIMGWSQTAEEQVEELREKREQIKVLLIISAAAYPLVIFLLWRWIDLALVQPLKALAQAAERVAAGGAFTLEAAGPREVQELNLNITRLLDGLGARLEELGETKVQLERTTWLTKGQALVQGELGEGQDLALVPRKVLEALLKHLRGASGALYASGDQKQFRLTSIVTMNNKHQQGTCREVPLADFDGPQVFRPGEGLVGQVVSARKRLILDTPPEEIFPLLDGDGALPQCAVFQPLAHKDEVFGLLILGLSAAPGLQEKTLLDRCAELLGAHLHAASASDLA